MSYSVLSSYAILASSGITTVNTTTVTNGYYGSSVVPTGAYVAVGLPSGENSADVTTAQTQLTSFITSNLNVIKAALPTQTTLNTTYGAVILTFYPNINYTSTSSITFTGTTINLDAQGDSNAQFYITAASSISFTDVPSINLLNGATHCNVFWVASVGSISFGSTIPPVVPGIFIASASITFANASIILGKLYAQSGNVTFSGTSSINATCPPGTGPSIGGGGIGSGSITIPLISNVCFVGNTFINTDQGEVLIKEIDTSINTIDGNKIMAITKTITYDKYLVFVGKNSLGENYPNKNTIMTKNHKVLYMGKLIEIYKFINHYDDIFKIKYNGQILYNVLMENYSLVNANNLQCESLDPNNIVAKLYNNFSDVNKNILINKINTTIKLNDSKNYKKLIKTII
jgi:hypothetical protein